MFDNTLRRRQRKGQAKFQTRGLACLLGNMHFASSAEVGKNHRTSSTDRITRGGRVPV